MKKLSSISLFIFGVILTAILTAGLVFYQDSKTGQVASEKTGALAQNTIDKLITSGKSLILNMGEISKHNKQSDCWMLIDGKVYDITSYFGEHPGGNSNMSATCGTDATSAYMTKDPNASSGSRGQDHSSKAKNLLSDYYLGDLNQSIGTDNTKTVNNVPAINNTVVAPDKIITPVAPITPTAGNITLNMTEIAKHNKSTDCWYLISGKVYNITSFFGSHPGGNSTMTPTCGKDATAAYKTKDAYATSGSGSAHSSNAVGMLANYYIGDLNQTIGQQKVTETNKVVAPTTMDDDDDEWDD
jgi:cytochrome b involved in lipid metabolism